MVALILAVFFVFLMYVFFRNYPSIEKKHGYRIFVLPSLLLWHAAEMAVNAYNVLSVSSAEFREKTGYWVGYKGKAEQISYESLLSNHKTMAYFYFFVAVCCVGFFIYEIFFDEKFQSRAIRYAMGIVIAVGIVATIVQGVSLYESLNYIAGSSLESIINPDDNDNFIRNYCLIILFELIVLAFLWFYFKKSLRVFEGLRADIKKVVKINFETENTDTERTKMQELFNLKTLWESGVIDKEEMETMKRKILGNNPTNSSIKEVDQVDHERLIPHSRKSYQNDEITPEAEEVEPIVGDASCEIVSNQDTSTKSIESQNLTDDNKIQMYIWGITAIVAIIIILYAITLA